MQQMVDKNHRRVVAIEWCFAANLRRVKVASRYIAFSNSRHFFYLDRFDF